jgi:hypothetical protein
MIDLIVRMIDLIVRMIDLIVRMIDLTMRLIDLIMWMIDLIVQVIIQHHDSVVTSSDLGLALHCQYDLGNKTVREGSAWLIFKWYYATNE